MLITSFEIKKKKAWIRKKKKQEFSIGSQIFGSCCMLENFTATGF